MNYSSFFRVIAYYKKRGILIMGALIGLLAALVLVPLTSYAATDLAKEIRNKSGSYTTVLYDNKNGLPTSEANAIAETEDGFIWIGSYSGLIRYDGCNFVRIDSASGIASVVSLFVDSKQRLWIGTNDSGVALMSKGFLQLFGKADGLTASSVRSITEDEKGEIYLATTSGVCVADENLKIFPLDIPQINDEFIHRLQKGPDGQIYGVTKDGDIFILDDRKLVNFYSAEDLNVPGTTHAFLLDEDNPGYAYIGNQESKILYGKLEAPFKTLKSVDISPIEYTNSIKLVDGQLWICADNGVGSIDNNVFHTYNNFDFNNSMEDMMVDYQGNFWFISSKLGVMKITPNQFTDISRQYKLEQAVTTSTCMYNGRLFIGNKNGGITVLGKDQEATFVRLNKATTASGKEIFEKDLLLMLKDTTVRSIIRDKKDDMWISTYSKYGLIRYNGSRVVCFTEEDGLPSNKVRVVTELANGDIVAACIGGVAVIRDDRIIKTYTEEDGVKNPEILTVCAARNGDILAGSDGGGIYVINDEGVKNVSSDQGLSSDIIMRIKRDSDKDIYWLVTSNAIGYLDADYKPTILRNFPYSNNFDIFFDVSGQGWILSSNGIYVVPRNELIDNVSEYDYTFYDSSNGLPCIATANSYNDLTDEGDLYISGTTGVARVNINKPYEDINTLKVDIPYVEADGEFIYADSEGVFNVPKGTSKLDITGYVFTYSLMNPDIIYYLEGFDNTKYSTKRNNFSTVSYTNLPGGKYRFVMDMKNAQGTELKEYSIKISKEKAVYEYFAVRVIMYLTLAAIGAFLVWRLMHITIISRQVEQIRAAKEEAERANTSKSRFLANMSHEIRTPINTIMGMNEMILREDTEDVPKEYLKNVTGYSRNIRIASESLLELINELLDLSKIESGKMELVELEYSTNDFLQSLAMMIRVRSNQKDLTFTTKIDEKLPKKLFGDVGKLKEVLLNLMTNAVKYTEKGGFDLIVDVEDIEEDKCRIHFSVKDTGIGIKPEDMEHLFTPFKRLEEVKNSGIQGTGLGLDISRQFVKLMGGELKCDSIYGEGSTFHFTIEQKVVDPEPLGEFREDDMEVEDEKYVAQLIAPDAKILVVDDNDMNLQVIKGLLKPTKIKLTLVSGGKECLEKLDEESFNMVLLDHMMPEMDGIETLHHIREKFEDLIVIALTANVVGGGSEFYKQAGFQDYLSKPVDSVKLEKMIKSYLPDELIRDADEVDDIPQVDEDLELPEDKKWLLQVPGLNVEDGLTYCGNAQQFIKFLNTFYDTLDDKSKEIEDAFNDGDIKLYTIKVHALKSTARIMGAQELSKHAEQLEAAGNGGDLEKINNETAELLTSFRAYKEKLSRIKEVEAEIAQDADLQKDPISENDLANAYEALKEFIPQMDYDAVEMIISEIKEYDLPVKDKELFDKLEKMLPSLNWEAMEALLG